MPHRVNAGAAIAAMIAIAPGVPGQAVAPAPVRVQPVSSPTAQQTVSTAHAMSVKPAPSNAAAMHTRVMPHLSTPAQSWVQSEARVIAGRRLSSSQMIAMAQSDAKSRFAGQGLSSMDIEQLAQLVMFQTAQETQNDLRNELAAMQKSNQQKAAQRNAAAAQKQQAAATKDTLKDHNGQSGDVSQEQQAKLQTYMDRMSQAEKALSDIMNRMSETSSGILSNLK